MADKDQPTWWDWHQLNFWLWACLHDGTAYLEASTELQSAMGELRGFPKTPQSMADFNEKRLAIQQRLELEKYHFVTAMGRLVPVLKRSQHLFPSIHPAYSRANHLLKEGLDLRGLIEHSDEYESGGGKYPERFEREAPDLLTNLPGDAPGVASATGTIIDNNGHWLGGRLNVERVLDEVRAIQEEANKLPPPRSGYPRP